MAPVPDEQGPVDLEETQEQRSPSSSDWPPFDVTIFSDLSGGRLRVEPHMLTSLANLCFARRASKSACELLKLATFGDVRSDKGSLRHDANIVSIHGVEVDYDAGEISFTDARNRLTRCGVACVIYTSPSHIPEKPRWRVLCPTAEPITAAVRTRLCDLLNGVFDGKLDPSSWTLSQWYYFGNCIGIHFRCETVPGAPIDICAFDGVIPIPLRPTRPNLAVGNGSGDRANGGDGPSIPEGRRNATLASLAGTMRRHGMSAEAIYAALAVANRDQCQPPLGDDEVRKIARSIGRYAPADDVPKPAKGLTVEMFEGKPAHRTFSWAPYLPKGGLLTFAGRGGIGKTTTAVAICAWGSDGKWPDGYLCSPIRSLIIEFQDDDIDEIKPKLIANGYDKNNVLRLRKKMPPTFDELEATIKGNSLGIVVISPGRKYVMQYATNENNDPEVEPVLDKLHDLGKTLQCLIILIKHTNKKPDLDALERVANAASYVNSARTVLFLVKDAASDLRVLESLKHNEAFAKWTWAGVPRL